MNRMSGTWELCSGLGLSGTFSISAPGERWEGVLRDWKAGNEY